MFKIGTIVSYWGRLHVVVGVTPMSVTPQLVEIEDRESGRIRSVPNGDLQLFDQVLARSFEDLRMLATRERGETFFAAGVPVPWFVCLFGRDSLVTALQTLAYDPCVAADTLLLLAKYQGRRHDE